MEMDPCTPPLEKRRAVISGNCGRSYSGIGAGMLEVIRKGMDPVRPFTFQICLRDLRGKRQNQAPRLTTVTMCLTDSDFADVAR